LRERVADDEWIALLETMALGNRTALDDPTFTAGAGI
jgi:hypothetical protein